MVSGRNLVANLNQKPMFGWVGLGGWGGVFDL